MASITVLRPGLNICILPSCNILYCFVRSWIILEFKTPNFTSHFCPDNMTFDHLGHYDVAGHNLSIIIIVVVINIIIEYCYNVTNYYNY